MDPKIVIDVTLGDRARWFRADGRLQKAAYDNVMQSLDACLSQAVDYKRPAGDAPGPSDELTRIHNAIFINGSRGAGKTAFMLNIKKAWEDRDKDKQSDLYFFNPVDPTLLDGTDSFVNVIVAHIYRAVSKYKNGGAGSPLWKAFEKVAEALEAGSTIAGNEVFGVERVMAARDHAELELNLNRFFLAACEILSVKALVILIDDVDMSLGWGFKVLEVVRRYLACPLIIPVISGDLKQYELLVMSHFAKELGVHKQIKTMSWRDLRAAPEQWAEDKSAPMVMARSLAVEYLKKVLPQHQRVRIRSIKELLEAGGSPIHVSNSSKNEGLELKALLDKLAGALSYNTNGVEGSRPAIEVDMARELLQLLQILYRQNLITGDIPDRNWDSRPDRQILAEAMGEYWRNQNRPDLYLRAQADRRLLGSELPSRLADIPFFDPLKHDQTIASYDLNASAQQLRDRLVPKQLGEIQGGPLPYSLVPMPVFEPMSSNLLIGKEEWKRHTTSNADIMVRFMMRLYSHSAHYTSYQTANLLFFGRAFEMIICHLYGKIDGKNLPVLFRNPPYLSYFHYNITQGSDPQFDDEGSEQIALNADTSLISGFEKTWLQKIEDWYKAYPMLREKPPSAQLIYVVLNKFFHQINLYKAPLDSTTPVAGTLADQHLRFQLILLNAFATFENSSGVVVRESFALGDLKNFRSAGAWKLNIDPLLKDEKGHSFTKALFAHPLFTDISGLERVLLTSTSSRSPVRTNKEQAMGTVSLAELNELHALGAALEHGEKMRATNAFLRALGSELRAKLWSRDSNNSELSQQIIEVVIQYKDQLSGYAKSFAAQILTTKGNPVQFNRVMTNAGRLEEFIRLLLDIA